MKQLIRNQDGTSAVEVVLIFVIVALIASVGWFVWNANKKTSKSLDDASKNQSEISKIVKKPIAKPIPTPVDETLSWLLYETPGKEYKLRIPDGWKLTRTDKDSIVYANDAKSMTYAKGTLATVSEVTGGRDFNAIAFLTSYQKDTALTTPDGTKQTGFTTDQGLVVTKYYNLVAKDPEVMGPPKGTKQYVYWIPKAGYTVVVRHDIQTGETDQTVLIEKAIKTLVIK